MNRRLLPLLLVGSVSIVYACGGRVGGAPSGTPVHPGTGGAPSGVDGGGGYAASTPVVGGAINMGAGAGSPGANVGGSTGYVPTAPDAGSAGPCKLPWWGTSLKGVVGATSCPAPTNPALLAYGDTQFPSCMKITGPTGSKYDGENLGCCYDFDGTACNAGVNTHGCVDLWYFGDGKGQTTLPTGSVAAQFAACKVPFGAPVTVDTQAARAQHLIGVWLRCGETGLPTLMHGNAIVFRADGTFQTLQTDDSGHLVPTTGCNQYGLWGFIAPASDNQVNLRANAGEILMANPTFTDATNGTPRQLRLDGGMGSVDTYVLAQ